MDRNQERLDHYGGSYSILSTPDMNTKLQAVRKTRAIAVQLNREVIDHLDALAQRSSMSRHRYMILLLKRAIRTDLVIKEEAIFSSGNI